MHQVTDSTLRLAEALARFPTELPSLGLNLSIGAEGKHLALITTNGEMPWIVDASDADPATALITAMDKAKARLARTEKGG